MGQQVQAQLLAAHGIFQNDPQEKEVGQQDAGGGPAFLWRHFQRDLASRPSRLRIPSRGGLPRRWFAGMGTRPTLKS